MRFSSGVLRDYYRIHLTQERADTVDALFTLAAHSLRRFEEARARRRTQFQEHHLGIYWRAFSQMLEEIYRFGDFSFAIDPCREGLENRESWSPYRIPESPVGPDIFDAMAADHRFPVGRSHPNESFLNDTD